MKEVRLPQFYEQAESVWKKFLQALPVIAFFLILFYSVIYLFGMQYTMIVSLVTVVFQVNYKKRNIPAGALTKLLVQQIFLLCLAYTATWNIILSLLLNLVVPFWLIFTKASQFNQLGYFSTLMTFTFMQFIPAGRSGFITQFEAMVFCCIFVFITIRLYQYINRGRQSICTERKIMQLFGCTLEKFLNGQDIRGDLRELFHMHHMYLRMLEDSLTNQLDYWRICDAQIQYHTALAQIRNDLPKVEKDEKDRSYYNRILNITWCMASEIQQMFFQIKHKKRGADARKIMEQYILYTDYVLNQIQEMLHLKKEKKLKNIEEMKYQRYIEGEPELSSLMTQYARNLSRLYVLVLRRVRNEY